MTTIEHQRPSKNPEGPPSHLIEIEANGEKVGRATMQYFSTPFPLYEISLGIKKEYRGRGFGGEIMDYIEKFLKQKGRAGVLIDFIADINPNSEAIGMYKERGWVRVRPDMRRFAFNIPKSGSIEQLRDYAKRRMNPPRFERVTQYSSDKNKGIKKSG